MTVGCGLPTLHAQGFPSKPVTMVVPYPAGGPSDYVARQVQPELSKALNQTVIVDNVGGVGGAIAIQKVLSAPADGHLLTLGTPMELVLAPLAMSAVKFKPEDMKGVLALIQELADFEKEPDAVVITEDDLIRDGFGTHPLFHVFVAEVDDNLVGIALYYYRYSTWKGKTIHLEDLVVKQSMRGTGLGYALYSEIIKQGKKDNVRRIEWAVLDWNTPAIAFYENSGAKVFDEWKIAQMDEESINYFVENKLK